MTDYASEVADRLARVRERIDAAARTAGRAPGDVRVVGVTKGHPLSAVEAAVAAGLHDVGENRVGELEEKHARYDGPPVRWHMVGHVQRRKVPGLVSRVRLVHSVDSARLARRFQSVAEREREEGVDVLLQVNTSGEEAKYGFSPDGFRDALGEILELSLVRVRGLMTMAPLTDDEEVIRKTFRGLRRLHEEARDTTPYEGEELSMGMSNDFEIGVEEGSTMVRIGTAIFGERPR